ncbi:MAG: hypothetical protein LBU32_06715 [Clostridiales bacterium]|nr:hypothetical protein [Clostridiales bacterium]
MPSSSTMRISCIRKDLIGKYATAAAYLYGAISISEFVDVFNRYESASTSEEEVRLALTRLAKAKSVEYSLNKNLITCPELRPGIEEDEKDLASIRESQKGKPRYLPEKAEFLRYADCTYFEPEKPYARLAAYILKHGLAPERGGDDESIEGDMLYLHQMIQFSVDPSYYMEYFYNEDYRFKDESQAENFARLILSAYSHTRMYDCNGFTPYEEMGYFGDQDKIIPFPKKPSNQSGSVKAGRNEP